MYIVYSLVHSEVSLNLSNNRLSSLPEDIGRLCGLQELFLQYNCLTELPVRVNTMVRHHLPACVYNTRNTSWYLLIGCSLVVPCHADPVLSITYSCHHCHYAFSLNRTVCVIWWISLNWTWRITDSNDCQVSMPLCYLDNHCMLQVVGELNLNALVEYSRLGLAETEGQDLYCSTTLCTYVIRWVY